MSSADAIQPARGPVSPAPAAAVAHRPLAGQAARLGGTGLLHDWQQRNRASSLPLALRQLEAAGNLGNLRLAIAGAHEGYRGPVFMDSDIYKTLEAIGWELSRGGDQELAELRPGDDRPAGEGPAAGRLPELRHPGIRPAAVQQPGLQPRDVLRRPPDPGGASPASAGPASTGCSGWPGGSPITWWTRSWAERRAGRPPDRGDRAGGAVPGDRAPAVPGAGQPVDRAARARADRQLRLRPALPAGPPAGPGDQHRGRARGPGAVPGGGRRGRGGGDRRRGAAAHLHRPLGRHDRHEDVPDRRERLTARGGELRRPVRAAAGPGLQRDLRGHRQLPVGLAAAAGHR